jgi:hypothetical protein
MLFSTWANTKDLPLPSNFLLPEVKSNETVLPLKQSNSDFAFIQANLDFSLKKTTFIKIQKSCKE